MQKALDDFLITFQGNMRIHIRVYLEKETNTHLISIFSFSVYFFTFDRQIQTLE